jgi:hypothetical protein
VRPKDAPMAEKLKEFRYHGPPIYIAAIDRNVEDGDTVKGPPALEQNAGFTPVQHKSSGKGGDD